MYKQEFELDKFLSLPMRGANTIINTVFGSGSISQIPPKVLEAAGLRGKEVHRAIEDLITTGTYEIDLEYEPYMNSFMTWQDKYNPTYVVSELKLYSHELNFKGIIDSMFYVTEGDKRILVMADWKTSSTLNKFSVTVQLNLYLYLFTYLSEHGLLPDELANLKFDELRVLSISRTTYKYVKLPIDNVLVESVLYLYEKLNQQ